MARMLIAIFGLSAAVAGAVFDHQAHGDLGALGGSGSNATVAAAWTCPKEWCLQCCQARARGFLGGGWLGKRRNDRFKCILRNSETLPPDCKDSEAQTEYKARNKQEQYKVTCPFHDGLTGSDAEARRKKLHEECSGDWKCCCDQKAYKPTVYDDYGKKATRLKRMSKKSGQRELFVRAKYQLSVNNNKPCVDPAQNKYKFRYQLKYDGELSYHDTCCLRVKTQKEEEVYTVTSDMFHKSDLGRLYTKPYSTKIYVNKAWKYCEKFETLYRCSEDEGVTQSGVMYVRYPSGKCYGNGCPKDKTEDNCLCTEDC